MSQTITKTEQRTKTPPQYKVLLLNDDYTPMDFVLYVLERFFNKSHLDAAHIMMEAHEKGVSVAGVYTFEIAETKIAQVLDAAKSKGYPLRVTLEEN
ncbi:MAG: ATP-dependent Clp protease adapter ClpS [Trueperaceae bacterium]